MTTVDRSTSRRARGGRRRSTVNSAVSADGVRRIAGIVWAGIWLVVVPLLVAMYVDEQVGNVWGAIPAFWLGGDPIPAGPNIAAALAVVGAVLLCAGLWHVRGDVLLGVVPVVGALIGRVGLDRPLWLGAVVGLVVGGLAFAWRRRQGR